MAMTQHHTQAAIDAVVDYLLRVQPAQRRPVKRARFYAWVVARRGEPIETRPVMAQSLDISLPGIDRAIDFGVTHGILRKRIETAPGNGRLPTSVTTLRYLDPSDELVEVVRKATE